MREVLRSERVRVIAGVSLLALLSCLPSLWAVANGHWPFDDDAIALFGPWRMWARESLQTGILPLWNPHLFGGMPFMSNGQTAVWYPPNIAYWLLPVRTAMLLDAIFHSALLGGGGYLLARSLRRGYAASWLCAVCLMLGNGVAAHLFAGHMTWHAARAYLPLIIWALVNFVGHGQRRYALVLAVLFGLQCYAGYPPYVVWSVCWCLVFLTAMWWARRANFSFQWRWLLASGILLAFLAAAVVLPLRETSALGAHGAGLDFEHATVPSSTPAGWMRLVVPNFFGGNRVAQWSVVKLPHEEAAYIGLLPLFLAVFAPLLWRWRQTDSAEDDCDSDFFVAGRFVAALWFLLPVSLLMALGKYTPLYQIVFDALPPFRMFRVPSRWFEIWYFAACVLAAFGTDALLRLHPSRRRSVTSGLLITALLLLGSAVAIVLSPASSSMWLEIAQWNKQELQVGLSERIAYAEYLRLMALQSVLIALAILVAGSLLLKRFLDGGSSRQRFWLRTLAGLIVVDLLLAFYSSMRFAEDKPEINPWPRNIRNYYLPGNRWNTALEDSAAGYGLNLGLPHSIDILGGYDTLATKDFFELAGSIEGRDLWSSSYQAQKLDPLLKVLGVTHILASHNSSMLLPLKAGQAREVAQFGPAKEAVQLWEVPGAWPRAYLAGQVIVASRNQQLSLLRELALQTPTSTTFPVVLDRRRNLTGGSSATGSGKVLHWARERNRFAITVESEQPRMLVLNETLSPGWKVWVNSWQKPVYRANFLFRGVEVPSGKSRVVFVYDNQTHRYALFLTLCGLGALAGIFSFATGTRRERRRE